MITSSIFRCSEDWSYGFLRRHDLSIRRRTHISQKLAADYEDKLLEFQKYIIKVRKQIDYLLYQIGHADQTSLTFDLPADTTIDHKNTSTANIRSTGNEKKSVYRHVNMHSRRGKASILCCIQKKNHAKDTFPERSNSTGAPNYSLLLTHMSTLKIISQIIKKNLKTKYKDVNNSYQDKSNVCLQETGVLQRPIQIDIEATTNLKYISKMEKNRARGVCILISKDTKEILEHQVPVSLKGNF